MTNETKRRWVVLWGLGGGRANRRLMKESVARTAEAARRARDEAWERSAASAAARALGPDHERRWGWLLRRRSRRVLVVASVATWALALPGGWIPDPGAAGLAFRFVLTAVAYLLLRQASRLITDLPDTYLDERQLQIRDESFTIAYKGLAGALSVAALVGLVSAVLASSDGTIALPAVSTAGVISAAWTVAVIAQSLPAAVLAWRESDFE